MLPRNYNAVLAGLGLFLTVTLSVTTGAYMLRIGNLIQAQLHLATDLKSQAIALTSEVYDRHGEKIGEFAGEQRYFVALKELPKPVIQAFLSAEDKNFYHHHGINLWSAVRAVVANLRGGQLKQGASTISQQLARLYFLDQSKTWERKVKEAMLALAIERQLTKDDILELYLNKIYLGNHSYGIEAAARNYFRKHANQLNIAEAAVLAGLPKSPNAYAPHRHKKAASRRQLAILMRMEDDGYLGPGEAAKWAKLPLSVAQGPEDYATGTAFVIQAVRAEISRKLELRQLPLRGLRIYTTIDAELQRAAAQQLTVSLQTSRKLAAQGDHNPGIIEGALISLNPENGAILAMQGGGDFKRSQFNRASATKRPLGALFLPIYIGLALESGYTLASRVGDDPLSGQQLPTGAPTLYDVLRDGSTVAGAPLYAALGHGSVQTFARRLGFHFVHQDLGLAYGTGAASPLQVAVAYAAFANGGRMVTPHLIEHVATANDHMIYQETATASRVQALNPATAYLVQEALRDAVAYGHAAKAKGVAPSAAGMGSSSEDRHDAWFVGSLPTIVSVLWNGAENGKVRLASNAAVNIDLLAKSWFAYMQAAPPAFVTQAALPQPPRGISYAKKPASVLRGAHSLPFLSGTEPKMGAPRRF